MLLCFRMSKEVQDGVKALQNSLAQITQAVGPFSDLSTVLRDYDAVTQNAMAELREQNRALMAQLEAERRENRLAQEQTERDVLRRMVGLLSMCMDARL
jgi:hypothetical protein